MSTTGGHIVLLLDGEPPSPRLAEYAAANAIYIAATDGAARTAKQLELPLHLIIGDLDSIDQEAREHFGSTRIIAVADQYSNDFEKAIQYILEQEVGDDLVILGMHGRRTDHTLTNLSVLVRFRDRFRSVRILDDHQEHRLLTKRYPELHLSQSNGSIISLTPLPHALDVTTSGLYYPITRAEMRFGQQEGLSNIINGHDGAHVTITDGALLVSMPYMNL